MVIVFGIDAVIDFCKCNAWKYRYRAGSKDAIEQDLAKSDWYINKAEELQKRKGKAHYFDWAKWFDSKNDR